VSPHRLLDVPPLRLVAPTAALALLLAACGGSTPRATDTGTPFPTETESPPPDETKTPSPHETDDGDTAPREVEGLIVQLIGGGVEGFVLDADGERFRILIDPDVDYGDFDAHHIEEHAQEGTPVAVKLRERGGKLYATKISDA
jgi:hypothetical protein